MLKIDSEFQDKCPDSDLSPHDTNHVYNCLNTPTDFDVSSLWIKPTEAAIFLKVIDKDVEDVYH